MVVLELEAVYAQAAPHTKLLNKRFLGAHHWLGPIKEALVARLAADKDEVKINLSILVDAINESDFWLACNLAMFVNI
ncbi:hypothetical protein PV327_000438 [Microctonus hyperodae]|uniref:Uncharacterized protein n=1 Tax=Microctonus hyperodae TaxID=165561 RepID=A0AA39G6N6_MICHY|nr:hypothetical protein PV327_000438 [Microctonus hyperodae]